MEGASGLGPLLGLGPGRSGPRTSCCGRPARTRPGEVVGRVVSPGEALTDYLDEHGMRRLSGRLAKAGRDRRRGHRRARAGRHPRARQGQAARAGRALRPHPARRPGGRARGHLPALGQGPGRRRHGRPDRHAGATTCWSCSATPSRCQVVLVTLPEETPVNEIVEHGVHAGGRGRRAARVRSSSTASTRTGPGWRRPSTPTGGADDGPRAWCGPPASAWPARRSRTSRWPACRRSCRSPRSTCPLVLHRRAHRRRPRASWPTRCSTSWEPLAA